MKLRGQIVLKMLKKGGVVDRTCEAFIYGCIAIHRLEDIYPDAEPEIKGWWLAHIPTGTSALPSEAGRNTLVEDGVDFAHLERLAWALNNLLKDVKPNAIQSLRGQAERIVQEWLYGP